MMTGRMRNDEEGELWGERNRRGEMEEDMKKWVGQPALPFSQS